jgi:two-component system sensor histidine kinase VicK
LRRQNVGVVRLPSPTRFFSMRWWLGLAFAGVAALTAVAVVSVLNARSERAFHKDAEAFAIGTSAIVAETLKNDANAANLKKDAAVLSLQHQIRVFVFAADGKPITPLVSRGIPWTQVPDRAAAKRAALAHTRYIAGRNDGSQFVVGLPLNHGAGAALVAFSRQQGLSRALGIIRNEFLQAALIAFAVGAALGLLIATLTARRLRRIAHAAGAIGAGDFNAPVTSKFPDEVGSLALSIERMRSQLHELFLTLEGDRDRLEHVFDRLDDGVLVVNRALEVEFANDRARMLIGDTRVLGRGPLRDVVLDLFRAGVPNHVRSREDERTLEIAGIPPAQGGESAIIVIHDESQKEQNERVQREFATNAAHELRTPLASIAAAVEMLETGAKDDPTARDEFLALISRETGRLTRLTRALLVLARADAGDEKPRKGEVLVSPLLEHVAASLQPHDGVELTVECEGSLTTAGDPDLLEQALSSIATNAMQHTDEGSIAFRAHAENGSVVIEVVDTGHGIPERERARIFDRFYRAADSEDGFGLGLSIAREAVGALGGDLELDSELGAGTTVRIKLERVAP